MPIVSSFTSSMPTWMGAPAYPAKPATATTPAVPASAGGYLYQLVQHIMNQMRTATNAPERYALRKSFKMKKVAPRTRMENRAAEIVQGLLENPEIARHFAGASNDLERARSTGVISHTAPYLASAMSHPLENVGRYEGEAQRKVLDAAENFATEALRERILPQLEGYYAGKGLSNSSYYDRKKQQALREAVRGLKHVGVDTLARAREVGLQSELAHAGHKLTAAQTAGTAATRDIERDLAAAHRAQEAATALQRREALNAEMANMVGSAERAHAQAEISAEHAAAVNEEMEPERQVNRAASLLSGLPSPAHETVQSVPTIAPPSMASTLGASGLSLLGASMMGGRGFKKGGRVKLQEGGQPPLDPSILKEMMMQIDPEMANSMALMQDLNSQPQSASAMGPMPSDMLAQDMSEGEPETIEPVGPQDMPPAPVQNTTPSTPLQQGAEEALNSAYLKTMAHMMHQRQDNRINPVGALLANMGASMAANQNPEFSARLGQAMPSAISGYKEALVYNQQQQQAAEKLHAAVQKTIALQQEKLLKHKLDQEKFVAQDRHWRKQEDEWAKGQKAPLIRSDPVSGGTYYIDPASLKATPIEGMPKPFTVEEKDRIEKDKLRSQKRIENDYEFIKKVDETAYHASKSMPILNQLNQLAPFMGSTGELAGELPRYLAALNANVDKRNLVEKLTADLVKENVKLVGGANPSNRELEFAQKITPSLKDNPKGFMYSLRAHMVARRKAAAYAPYVHDMYEKYNIPMYEIQKSWNEWDANNRLLSPDLKTFHIPSKTPLDYLSKEQRDKIPADYSFNDFLMGSEIKPNLGETKYSPSYLERVRAELAARKSISPEQKILANASGGIDTLGE